MCNTEPNLLMRAWMMAHLYGAEYQAVVCLAGSSGEVAFRESLCPQYTSDRHDAKGLRTYYINGTCGDTRVSRITSGRIGDDVPGTTDAPQHITVTSNTSMWHRDDFQYYDRPHKFLIPNTRILTLNLEVARLVTISPRFLGHCVNLQHLDLGPQFPMKEGGDFFLNGCTGLTSINIAPLHAIETIPEGFLAGCSGLKDVDLTPLIHVQKVGPNFLQGCSGPKGKE